MPQSLSYLLTHVVFSFDECRRSRFGDHHKAIKEFSLTAQLFGLTSTYSFDKNSSFSALDMTESSNQSQNEQIAA
jgi:type I site-specific restriction-modification system R (restriction) subunit